MKIMVLNNDQAGQAVIDAALKKSGHEILKAENSQDAWDLLERGDSRFVIADSATTDIDEKGFIARLRSTKLPAHVYVLLVLPKTQDQDHTGADDYLYKPLTASELKSRIAIGERILGLGDNLSEAKDQLENLALLDHITNLHNRKAFLSMAGAELERARRTQDAFSLIALDIRDFENLNDFHGPETSHNVLRLLAQLIRDKCRPYDCIGRWDASEFIIALPGVIGADAEKVVERILGGIRSMDITTAAGLSVRVELGAGIAAASRISASTEIEGLIHQALQALLRAREGGGNQIYLTYI
jgi:two-component system, cell cycle response regulator